MSQVLFPNQAKKKKEYSCNFGIYIYIYIIVREVDNKNYSTECEVVVSVLGKK